jgi:hypothetical protein
MTSLLFGCLIIKKWVFTLDEILYRIYIQTIFCLSFIFLLGGGGGGNTERVDGVAITIATPPMLNN